MKTVLEIFGTENGHWVGDGFPVRSVFSYQSSPESISPFLLFDYAGPYNFDPNSGAPRGVGQHPHRGIETVTLVYDGEVSHADSLGSQGTIGPGDVQWMTAAGGILHEEFHSKGFSKTGGPFQMVQLWVNLPAKDKMGAPRYQAITKADIPVVSFEGGRARVIAGEFGGESGPALTFTPINLWDVRMSAGAETTFELPVGHNSLIAVLSGRAEIAGRAVGQAEIARLSSDGAAVTLTASGDTLLLVMTGEPINEPVAGRGPFVMNTDAEIREAYADYKSGALARPAN